MLLFPWWSLVADGWLFPWTSLEAGSDWCWASTRIWTFLWSFLFMASQCSQCLPCLSCVLFLPWSFFAYLQGPMTFNQTRRECLTPPQIMILLHSQLPPETTINSINCWGPCSICWDLKLGRGSLSAALYIAADWLVAFNIVISNMYDPVRWLNIHKVFLFYMTSNEDLSSFFFLKTRIYSTKKISTLPLICCLMTSILLG